MIYHCCEALRRNAVRAHATLNGIDFLEVLDRDAPSGTPRQQTLLVRLLKPVPATFGAGSVRIEGGERITPVKVVWAGAANASPSPAAAEPNLVSFLGTLTQPGNVLVVRTDSAGDFSRYTLRLITSPSNPAPPAGFDPLLSHVEFSFKAECPSEFDCAPAADCPPEARPQPEIDYLAKDFASFRRLMLDRMALLMPGWRERSPADLGVTLVELLAYMGDHLSYQQDAVATEAYLGTARRRSSVRRHARLVDYAMHDGCNARAWVQFTVDADITVETGLQLLTRVPDQPAAIAPGSAALAQAMTARPLIFETVESLQLFKDHNQLPLYTWGDKECCLPRSATRATLRGHFPKLQKGEVLIFEEVIGPHTGTAADADPAHRHAVRLTEVVHSAGNQPLKDPLTNVNITEIAWDADDALPFPLCISARTDAEAGGTYLEGISVARGNVVLADHGRTLGEQLLDPGEVPPVRLFFPPETDAHCADRRLEPVPPRYRPRLREVPLTVTGPYDPDVSAISGLLPRPAEALPAILELTETTPSGQRAWTQHRDLLNSGRDDRHFVVETEADGTARLRFGDDQHGLRPEPGGRFTAKYRVGSGSAGNVGAESIAHAVTVDSAIIGVRNPLAATGGTDRETVEEVRVRAPAAFRTQERAVTPEDYAAAAERHPGVQRAAATLRWTGSWHTVFVTVDRLGGRPVDDAFKAEMIDHLDRFRMAGHDLEIDGPRFVSLEIEMQVCVAPDHFRVDVKQALLNVFSRRALFHPDRFTFGQTVHLSPLIAAAQAVPGVASVTVTKFQRQGTPDPRPLQDGKLPLDRLEIARLDNDPNFTEHGTFRLKMGGGK